MWKDQLKREWNERPLNVIAVAALAAPAVARLLDSVTGARSRRAYAKQVDYKIKHKR